MLRVAIVGCGIISEWHIKAYQQFADRAKVTLCCDIDIDRAQHAAHLAGNAGAVADYQEVLSDPHIDAVEICTPHHLHAQAVVQAARAGKHILCQKPLASTLADCDIAIEAAKSAGVVLFYGETNHTLPAALEARRVIAQGRIGRLVGTQSTMAYWQGGAYLSTSWRYDPAIAGGGQLLDSGIHAIDLIRSIGGPIRSVSCFATNFRPELGGEDTTVVNFRFEAGQVGALFSSQACGAWLPYPGFCAFGTEGLLTLGGRDGVLVLHRPDLPDRREVLVSEHGHSFVEMIGAYLDCVVDGAENPSPGEVGRENLRIVLAAYESARTGRETQLTDAEPNLALTPHA